MAYEENTGRAFGWDDEIQNDGPDYVLLPDGDYPFTVTHAVDQALQFASSCVKTWEYCKENGCDVYLNPHPHLCDLLKLAEENQSRKTGKPNAFVIGTEGVRKWVVERFDVCLDCAQQFTDIRAEYKNRE